MAKKKNENKRKRLKSLVLLLLLTVLLLSTSTYAWFTSNKSVSIAPIDVHIAAASGLQISSDATVWKTMLTTNDITTGYSGHKNMLSAELTPVSTTGALDSGYLKFFKGEVKGYSTLDGALALTATATPAEAAPTTERPNGEFVSFDIFLKVDEGQDIYLERGSGVTNQTSKTPKYLEYAARYAFVIEGSTTATDTVANMQSLVAASTKTNADMIIEPNYDAHTDTAVTNAATYYQQTITAATSGQNPVDYVGVKQAITDPIILKNTNPGCTGTGCGTVSSTYFEAVPSANLKKTNVAYSDPTDANYSYYGKGATDYDLVKVFTLPAGVTKVRVYMWIEGQDLDCENNASGAYLTFNLGLALRRDDNNG